MQSRPRHRRTGAPGRRVAERRPGAEASPDGAAAFRQQLDNAHPLGHVGEPDDIAYGVLYLASDEARFVTGAQLLIDRGYAAQ
ncbi:MAG: SDR family oxidoreductase [Halioglobus sp.]|nr:SDR family oxidoreductase [Halioglobus sp.]